MEVLFELVEVVNKKRLSKIDVFDKGILDSKNLSLYSKLYQAIYNKTIQSDSQAANYLYGTSKDDPKYRMLKSRFKNKLIKSLLLLDGDDVFSSQIQKKVYYECLTNYYAIETIIKITGTTKLVYSLIKENYPKAEKYNFYEILKNYSYQLLLYYSLIGDKKSFLKEEVNYEKYRILSDKEQVGKHIYNRIVINFVDGTPVNDELIAYIRENLKDLEHIMNDVSSAEINFYYFYSLLLYHECLNHIDQILHVCNIVEKLLTDQPHISNTPRKILVLLYRMKAYLNAKETEKGIALLNNFDIVIAETNYNWFIVKEYEFKLYFQARKIKEASEVYKQVSANKFINRHGNHLAEKWKIFHAYLVFMDNYLNQGNYKFNISKFLNDVPISFKDKSGFNFAVRILEILFLFARKEYNFIFQKTEALRVYRTRYLNDNTHKRNQILLALLLKAEKSGFKGSEMKNILFSEFNDLQIRDGYIIADWEIIPYEDLWNIIVNLSVR